nr:MAG TPA: hypothetical protein [Caudoviricetes sp.]
MKYLIHKNRIRHSFSLILFFILIIKGGIKK